MTQRQRTRQDRRTIHSGAMKNSSLPSIRSDGNPSRTGLPSTPLLQSFSRQQLTSMSSTPTTKRAPNAGRLGSETNKKRTKDICSNRMARRSDDCAAGASDTRIRRSSAGRAAGFAATMCCSPLHALVITTALQAAVVGAVPTGGGAAPTANHHWRPRARDSAFASAAAFQRTPHAVSTRSSRSSAARLVCSPVPDASDRLVCGIQPAPPAASSRFGTRTPTTSLSATIEDLDRDIRPDVEFASHSTDDKVLHYRDLIGGTVNITRIEDYGDPNEPAHHVHHHRRHIVRNGHTVPKRNGRHAVQFGYDQLAEAAFVPRSDGPANAAAGADAEVDAVAGAEVEEDVDDFEAKDALEEMQHLHDVRSRQEEEERESEAPVVAKTLRTLWRRRHARSIEEGIRSEGIDGKAVTPPTKPRSDRRTYKTARELSSLLRDASTSVTGGRSLKRLIKRRARGGERPKPRRRRYAARTIAGLIVALAEESENLEVEVDARRDTPLWGKRVDSVKINFSRLGFRQLRMGGLDAVFKEFAEEELARLSPDEVEKVVDALHRHTGQVDGGGGEGDVTRSGNGGAAFGMLGGELDGERHDLVTADEAFDRIDADNSGALDEEELAAALGFAADAAASAEGASSPDGQELVAAKSREVMTGLASRLVRLYDTNGDGVVDRAEYRSMVKDMAALRRAKRRKQREKEEERRWREVAESGKGAVGDEADGGGGATGGRFKGWRRVMAKAISKGMSSLGLGKRSSQQEEEVSDVDVLDDENVVLDLIKERGTANGKKKNGSVEPSVDPQSGIDFKEAVDVSNSVDNAATFAGEGSIVLSDLKMDLRRLIFGAVPWVKKITPGGPLILEPFTMTVTASLNPDDIMNSILIDNGLRRLVARALSRRVRSFRDLVDGAVFYGRTWNVVSRSAPQVEVPKLENVEFDDQDRMIISGRARVRAGPDAPIIENAFKLRTQLGTRGGGRYIRLKNPELALILECPKPWERNIVSACKNLNLPVPKRPRPLYAYFPLVSPLKQTEQDGFNLGEDNCIQSIETKDGALRIEMSAVIRPGRFLGNHYLAFTVPNKTLIITLDKVKEGMRVARKNKLAADVARRRALDEAKRRASDAYGRAAVESLSDRALPAAVEVAKGDDGTAGGDESSDAGPKSYTPLGDVLGSKLAPKETEFRFSDADSSPATGSEEEESDEKKPGFFGKFVEGYLGAGKDEDEPEEKSSKENEEERSERLMTAISEWFGMQDPNDWDDDDEHPAWRTV